MYKRVAWARPKSGTENSGRKNATHAFVGRAATGVRTGAPDMRLAELPVP